MKRFGVLIPVLLLACLLCACSNASCLSERQIFKLVNEQEATLQTVVETMAASDPAFSADDPAQIPIELKGVQRIYQSEKKDCAVFECGGKGIGSETTYRGFYYNPAGTPSAFDSYCQDSELAEGCDAWVWSEPDGDNTYLTKHIKGNWYYYEAHF